LSIEGTERIEIEKEQRKQQGWLLCY